MDEKMGSELTVVVAEDDRDLRELIQYTLESDGYAVEAFESGDDCWRRLATGDRPDLVLLDVMLPGMDGPHILERIRADDSFADVPVVFLSGHSPEQGASQAEAADDYITKPFTPSELRARISQLL